MRLIASMIVSAISVLMDLSLVIAEDVAHIPRATSSAMTRDKTINTEIALTIDI